MKKEDRGFTFFSLRGIMEMMSAVLCTNEVMLRTNEVMLRTNEVMLRINEVMLRTNEVILCPNEVKFGINVVFVGEDSILPLQALTPTVQTKNGGSQIHPSAQSGKNRGKPPIHKGRKKIWLRYNSVRAADKKQMQRSVRSALPDWMCSSAER